MVFNNTVTPVFTLTTGMNALAIVTHQSGTVCNFNFNINPFTGVVSGAQFTSGQPINFTQTPTRGQLLKGAYDFCIQYVNAPVTGITTLTITFS